MFHRCTEFDAQIIKLLHGDILSSFLLHLSFMSAVKQSPFHRLICVGLCVLLFAFSLFLNCSLNSLYYFNSSMTISSWRGIESYWVLITFEHCNFKVNMTLFYDNKQKLNVSYDLNKCWERLSEWIKNNTDEYFLVSFKRSYWEAI